MDRIKQLAEIRTGFQTACQEYADTMWEIWEPWEKDFIKYITFDETFCCFNFGFEISGVKHESSMTIEEFVFAANYEKITIDDIQVWIIETVENDTTFSKWWWNYVAQTNPKLKSMSMFFAKIDN